MSVPYPKGGNIVWTCGKDNIIKENEDYEAIGLYLFEEEEVGGVQEGLYGYPYLNNLTQLWPGDWVKYMGKTNEAVGKKNRLDKSEGRKRPVRPFTRNEFWKCIG